MLCRDECRNTAQGLPGRIGKGGVRLPLVSRSTYHLCTKTPIGSFQLILWSKDFLSCFVLLLLFQTGADEPPAVLRLTT